MARSVKTLLVLLVLLSVATGVASQELSLDSIGGKRLSEGDLAQGTHIVVFWTSWAPKGRNIVERVNALEAKWGDRANVITVNFQEDRATVDGFLRGKSMSSEVFLDASGAFSKKYRVNSAPWLLVMKDGNTSFSARTCSTLSVKSSNLRIGLSPNCRRNVL